jgi:hypothetical protein
LSARDANDVKQFNVYLPSELIREVERHAVETGQSLSAIVAAAVTSPVLRLGSARALARSASGFQSGSGLAPFDFAKDAITATLHQVAALAPGSMLAKGMDPSHKALLSVRPDAPSLSRAPKKMGKKET